MSFVIFEDLEFVCSLMLCGIIWLVQCVHYPAFRFVAQDRFVEFEEFHSRNISFIVAPLMLLEAGSAIVNLINSPKMVGSSLLGALLIGIIWFVTFFYSVPCHRILANGFDVATHRRLIKTNWYRTLAWSARVLLLTVSTY